MKETIVTTISIGEKVTSYVREKTLSNVNNLNDNTLLFKEGIFDSMGFVLLIDFIEETFAIKLSDEDLVEENFESIKAITLFVHQKKELTS